MKIPLTPFVKGGWDTINNPGLLGWGVLQQLANALVLGAVYAFALGFTLIFGVLSLPWRTAPFLW